MFILSDISFFWRYFLKYQCTVCKCFILLVKIEKWGKTSRSWGVSFVHYWQMSQDIQEWTKSSTNFAWSILEYLDPDLRVAIDCILHNLIITKLEIYGFQTDALEIVYGYSSNRKQGVKIKHLVLGKNLIWYSTRIYSWSSTLQYTSTWRFLLP